MYDPINKRLMMEIKNPKIPIQPYQQGYEGINLVEQIEHFNNKSIDFGFKNNTFHFDKRKQGWEVIFNII